MASLHQKPDVRKNFAGYSKESNIYFNHTATVVGTVVKCIVNQ